MVHTKRGSGRQRMINPRHQEESVAMQELDRDASLLDEMVYYGGVIGRRMDLHGQGGASA